MNQALRVRAAAATALSLHSSFRTRLPADARPRVAAAVVAALPAAPSVKAGLPTPVKKKVESVLSPAPSTKEAAALDNTLAAAAAAVLRTAGVVVNDVGCTGMATAAPACTAFVAVEARCTAPLAAPGTAVVAEAAAAVAVGADSRTAAAPPACGPSPCPVQTTSCAVDGSPVALACA